MAPWRQPYHCLWRVNNRWTFCTAVEFQTIMFYCQVGRGHCRGPSFQKKVHEVKSQDTSVISRCCVKNCKRTTIIPTFPQLSADLESAFHNKDFADVKVELNSILTIYQRILCFVWISLNQFYIMNQFEPVLYELYTRWHVVTGYLSATNSCSGGLFVGYS